MSASATQGGHNQCQLSVGAMKREQLTVGMQQVRRM